MAQSGPREDRPQRPAVLARVLLLILAVFGAVLPAAAAQAAPPMTAQAQWSGWGEVPAGGATTGAPTAATYRDFEYLFVRGTDSRIYVNLHNGVAWTGSREVPSGGATPDSPGATTYRGSVYLFVRGTDNRIYLNQFNGSAWTGWGEVPAGGATPSGPGANVYQGVLHLFVRGTDNRIYLNRVGPDFP